jgi:hypothetical protein
LDQFGIGEDLGEEQADPLTRIGRRMRTVEERIAASDTSEPTQRIQRNIVEELAALITQQKQQSAAGQRAPQSSSGRPQAQAQQPGAAPASQAARQPQDSEERLDRNRDQGDGGQERMALAKEVWGHLPQRVQDAMSSGLPEQFLPKYEQLIEEYYRRLAEEQR